MDKFSLSGKTALITGGSKGIGYAIAEEFADAGANIVILARNEKQLEEAAGHIRKKNNNVLYFSFDMKNIEDIENIYQGITENCGGIDILVNNAGVTRRGAAESIEIADWEFVLQVNLTATFRLSQMFGRERIEKKLPGKIINIASLLSECARKENTPYASSKGGVKLLTKSLAVDWAKYGINVNAIGPGYIRTDLNKVLQDDQKFDKWVRERTPLGKWGDTRDIAATARFLASPASDFMTGQIIYVDGGILSCF